MDKEQVQTMATIIGVALASGGSWLLARREARKPAEPPPERPPTVNDTKAALEGLREDIARLHSKVDRHGEISEDEWHDINRKLDRIENAQLRASLVQDWRDRSVPPIGSPRE